MFLPQPTETHDRHLNRYSRAASFSRGADVYAAVRPSYPVAAIDYMLPNDARTVLDLAAGTGKLTTLLNQRNLNVIAVDQSVEMLAQLRQSLPQVAVHQGTAEQIPLPSASLDAVIVGQAWHWFDEPAAAAEIARVLRPGGTLSIVWNKRDTNLDWVAQFGEILHRDDPLKINDQLCEATNRHPEPSLGHLFSAPESESFAWSDWVATASLRALAGSHSFLLTLPDAERESRLTEVDELVASHPDLAGREHVSLPYIATAYRATRLP